MSHLSGFSMWDLFRGEVESQMRSFTDHLLAVEGGTGVAEHLAATMRAAMCPPSPKPSNTCGVS